MGWFASHNSRFGCESQLMFSQFKMTLPTEEQPTRLIWKSQFTQWLWVQNCWSHFCDISNSQIILWWQRRSLMDKCSGHNSNSHKRFTTNIILQYIHNSCCARFNFGVFLPSLNLLWSSWMNYSFSWNELMFTFTWHLCKIFKTDLLPNHENGGCKIPSSSTSGNGDIFLSHKS